MEFWEKFSVAITAPCNDAACCRDEKLNIPDGVWFGDRSARDQRLPNATEARHQQSK